MTDENEFEGGMEPIDLGPGDLAIVIRMDGQNEVYFLEEEDENAVVEEKPETVDGSEPLDEPAVKAKYLAEFILFAISDPTCQEVFARTRLN